MNKCYIHATFPLAYEIAPRYRCRMHKHPLTAYREKHGVSMEALAAIARTSRQTIFRIERFEQNPSIGLISKIIRATDGAIRADDFLIATEN